MASIGQFVYWAFLPRPGGLRRKLDHLKQLGICLLKPALPMRADTWRSCVPGTVLPLHRSYPIQSSQACCDRNAIATHSLQTRRLRIDSISASLTSFVNSSLCGLNSVKILSSSEGPSSSSMPPATPHLPPHLAAPQGHPLPLLFLITVPLLGSYQQGPHPLVFLHVLRLCSSINSSTIFLTTPICVQLGLLQNHKNFNLA